MIFTDDTPLAPTDPVASAQRSPAAKAKAASHHTTDGLPAYNLTDLIEELAILCPNQEPSLENFRSEGGPPCHRVSSRPCGALGDGDRACRSGIRPVKMPRDRRDGVRIDHGGH
jgi:hypothetical protein